MTSRRYIKRIWRVPKHRGPEEYLAMIIVKSLVKHGWPAKWAPLPTGGGGFNIRYDKEVLDMPPDFLEAVDIATRIAARTHRVDISYDFGTVIFNRRYRVTDAGFFREIRKE